MKPELLGTIQICFKVSGQSSKPHVSWWDDELKKINYDYLNRLTKLSCPEKQNIKKLIERFE